MSLTGRVIACFGLAAILALLAVGGCGDPHYAGGGRRTDLGDASDVGLDAAGEAPNSEAGAAVPAGSAGL